MISSPYIALPKTATNIELFMGPGNLPGLMIDGISKSEYTEAVTLLGYTVRQPAPRSYMCDGPTCEAFTDATVGGRPYAKYMGAYFDFRGDDKGKAFIYFEGGSNG